MFQKFEEYISAALASVKYADFMAKGEGSGVLITPGSGRFSSHSSIIERMVITNIYRKRSELNGRF